MIADKHATTTNDDLDILLDQALADTFPASDPVALDCRDRSDIRPKIGKRGRGEPPRGRSSSE